MDPLQAWQQLHQRVGLTVFIDDLMCDSTAPQEHQVTGRLAAGAAALRTAVEEELGCSVANHKSAIIASSTSLLNKCKKAFGRFAGTAAESAVNLGVDTFAGKKRALRRSTPTLQKRRRKLLRRVRRLQMVKKAGYDMRELHITGLQQYAYHGAGVVGINRLSSRQLAPSTWRSRGPQRSRHLHRCLWRYWATPSGDKLWDHLLPTLQ